MAPFIPETPLNKLNQISSILIELENGECNSSFFLRQEKHREIHSLVLSLKSSLSAPQAGNITGHTAEEK